jgi:hypothetical protein
MQILVQKGENLMKFGEAKSKIANLHPNLQAWLQKEGYHCHEQRLSESFQKDLQPLIAFKESMQQLEAKTSKLHYLMGELRSHVKKS